MRDTTFDYIWEDVILKQIHILEESISEEDKIRYELTILDVKAKKRDVFLSYNRIRNNVKTNYYDTKRNGDDSQSRIDNHKIAACLCYSLIQNKMFHFKIMDGMPKKLFTLNYELAYRTSLNFIFLGLISEYYDNNMKEYADELLKQGTLNVPQTSDGHDEYHLGRVHTLALNDIYGNTFDILTYSDMMFWIEFYNRQLIKNKIAHSTQDIEI